MEQKVFYPANGSVATASMLFIPLSIAFGFLVYRKNAPLVVSSVAGVLLLALCIVVGLKYPIYLSKTFWLGVVFVYIFIASVTPVWILLQPRDYLNSFLLYFMIIAAVIGILGTNPTINLPAFTGWTSSFNGQVMFPYLFITVACGAISGFHSLIASGTTSKQLNNEGDAKLIGYGSILKAGNEYFGNSKDYVLNYANILISKFNDKNSATNVLENYLKTNGNNNDVIKSLADIYTSAGNVAKAASLLKEINKN